MVLSTSSKSLRLAIALAALAAATVVSTPAALARPEVCVQWAWSRCDPYFDRLTPEWGACFEANVEACEATQPGPPPNFPWAPWPWPGP